MEVVCFTLRQSLPSRIQGPTPTEDGVTRTPESCSGRFTENRTPYAQSVTRVYRLCVLNFFLLGNIFTFNKLNRWLAEWFAETLENIFCLSNICTAESRAKQLCRCLFEKNVSYHRPDGSPSHGAATDGVASNEKWWTCCTQHKTIDNRSPIPNIKSRSFKLYEIQDRGAKRIRGIDRITVRSATLSNHSWYRKCILPESRLAHRGILGH